MNLFKIDSTNRSRENSVSFMRDIRKPSAAHTINLRDHNPKMNWSARTDQVRGEMVEFFESAQIAFNGSHASNLQRTDSNIFSYSQRIGKYTTSLFKLEIPTRISVELLILSVVLVTMVEYLEVR